MAGLAIAVSADAQTPFSNIEQQVRQQIQALGQMREQHSHEQIGEVMGPAGPVAVHAAGIDDLVSWRFQDPGEFLVEQGDALREVTRKTGWEVCARLCLSRDGRWGLRPGTLQATSVCAVADNQCPAGMIGTNRLVHTHGAGAISEHTAVDRALGVEGEWSWTQDANAFSPADLEAGEGWLLTPDGRVLHHDGSGKVEQVADPAGS